MHTSGSKSTQTKEEKRKQSLRRKMQFFYAPSILFYLMMDMGSCKARRKLNGMIENIRKMLYEHLWPRIEIKMLKFCDFDDVKEMKWLLKGKIS